MNSPRASESTRTAETLPLPVIPLKSVCENCSGPAPTASTTATLTAVPLAPVSTMRLKGLAVDEYGCQHPPVSVPSNLSASSSTRGGGHINLPAKLDIGNGCERCRRDPRRQDNGQAAEPPAPRSSATEFAHSKHVALRGCELHDDATLARVHALRYVTDYLRAGTKACADVMKADANCLEGQRPGDVSALMSQTERGVIYAAIAALMAAGKAPACRKFDHSRFHPAD